MIECIGCGEKFDNISEFEDHLLNNHFLQYQEYCELELMKGKDDDFFCYKCSKYRNPMTFLMRDEYYLPCWGCIRDKKAEKLEAVSGIQRDLKDYYGRILGDRYYQLYIIDSIYFKSTLPHNYSVFKKVLGTLDLPSRNDIWFVDWKPGYPKIISEDNIDGIKVINLSDLYQINNSEHSLKINNYELIPPEIVPYDVRHHFRYNLVSKTSCRSTKRLKLSDSGNCVKFFNTNNGFKSIFKIIDSNTKEEIGFKNLTYQDFTVIKLALLRNKNFVRQIYEIIYETLKYSYIFRDSVFLKNTITVSPNKELRKVNLCWTPEDKYNEEDINICILW